MARRYFFIDDVADLAAQPGFFIGAAPEDQDELADWLAARNIDVSPQVVPPEFFPLALYFERIDVIALVDRPAEAIALAESVSAWSVFTSDSEVIWSYDPSEPAPPPPVDPETNDTPYDFDIVIRKSLGADAVADLDGAAIIIRSGTLTETEVARYFSANNMSYNPILFTSDEEMIEAYEAGRGDVLAVKFGDRALSLLASPSDHIILDPNLSGGPIPPPDTQTGTDGDDSFQSTDEVNDNRFDGGVGRDSVVYRGTRDQYTVAEALDGAILVQKPDGGTDTLTAIEKLGYSDQLYNLEIRGAAASLPEVVVDALVDLYIAYFNRVAEASGLLYWIDQYKAGQNLDQIAARFYEAGITFSSFTGYSADMPLQDFVAIVYRNVLDRTGADAPSQPELDYWINQIANGAVTREGLVKQVLADARLFYGDPAVGYVPELLDKKVELGRLHAVTLGIDYLSAEEAISKTIALASAVTPAGIDRASDLIGLGPETYIA